MTQQQILDILTKLSRQQQVSQQELTDLSREILSRSASYLNTSLNGNEGNDEPSFDINTLKKYIEDNKLKIKSIMTNFSKNRINESIKMRGMSSKITENYEIEVPHQVYICDYILGGRSTLLMLEQKDMHNIDRTLKNHGYSFSLVRNKDVLISHQCDLTSNTLHKGMTIYCENNVVISVEYSIYDKDLDCLRNSRVVVYKDRKKILDEEIIDDNMYYCLKEYYEYFNSKKENNIYKERIINFSNIMKEYKGFSKEYC